MNPTVITRAARVLAWLLAATASGVAWYAVSIYGLENYDRAYGRTAIFQISSTLAFGFAIVGLVGYAAAIAILGSRQSVSLAFAAGALFAVVMQCVAFALGAAIPNGVPWLLPISLALLLGAGTSRLCRHNEA